MVLTCGKIGSVDFEGRTLGKFTWKCDLRRACKSLDRTRSDHPIQLIFFSSSPPPLVAGPFGVISPFGVFHMPSKIQRGVLYRPIFPVMRNPTLSLKSPQNPPPNPLKRTRERGREREREIESERNLNSSEPTFEHI